MRFFDFAGIPDETRAAVMELAKTGRIPQSVMFTGGEEKIRNSCGQALAAAVLCLSPKNGVPCGKCKSCIKVQAGSHPDLITLAPEDGKKSISKEQVSSRVIENLYVAPNEAENKVYVFPDAEDLSPVIQNALLKSIEEPPPFVMFIFLCERRESMLETVLSRCTELSLGDLREQQKKKEAAEASEIAAALAQALCGGTEFDLHLAAAPMQKNRTLMKKTAQALTLIIRDAMAADANVPTLSGHERQALLLGSMFGTSQLLRMKEVLETIRAYADSNANENLLLCKFSSGLISVKESVL